MLTGLFTMLAKRGVTTISTRTDRIDQVLVKVFDELETKAEANQLELTFRVRRGLHGSSSRFRHALKLAVLRDRVSIDGPENQDIRLSPTKLPYEHLDHLPGGPALYEGLANVFLAAYEPEVESHRSVTGGHRAGPVESIPLFVFTTDTRGVLCRCSVTGGHRAGPVELAVVLQGGEVNKATSTENQRSSPHASREDRERRGNCRALQLPPHVSAADPNSQP